MYIKKYFQIAAICSMAALGLPAGAATITFDPLNDEVAVGESIEIGIIGDAFTAGGGGTVGGGLTVTWDPALLSLESYSTDVFEGDKFFANDNTTTVKDDAAGELRNLSVLSLSGVTVADFDIATLVFRGVQPGVSALGLEIGLFDSDAENDWWDSNSVVDVDPTFDGTNVTVSAVPLPAALPLLVSALLGLGAVARLRKSQRA